MTFSSAKYHRTYYDHPEISEHAIHPCPPPPTPLDPSFTVSTNDVIEGTILTLKTLESFGNGELLLSALRDAISEHGQKWYESNGKDVHGKVSLGTIGIVLPTSTPTASGHVKGFDASQKPPKGFLVSIAEEIPANPVFQSVKALVALSQKAEHDETAEVASETVLNIDRDPPLYLDDLESFYYVLLYLCIPYTVVGLGERRSDSQDNLTRGDMSNHAFNTINTEILLQVEIGTPSITAPKLVQDNADTIGLSDLSWITNPTSLAAIHAKKRIMSSTPRETQDYHDAGATARHIVRKSFHPPWVFERLLGQLLVILQKCDEREMKMKATSVSVSHGQLVDGRMMDYIHFIQAFDKAINRVRKHNCGAALDPFMNYKDWDVEVDQEVYFNLDDEDEDRRPLPLWMSEWLGDAKDEGSVPMGSELVKRRLAAAKLRELGLGFPKLKGIRNLTRM